MTATKVDSIASKPMQSNKYSYVHDVQRSVPRVTKRCLFGPPDQTELQKIWKDNLENERQRMINKYGFDVKTEKFVGSQTHGVSQSDTKNCTSSNRLCNNNTKNTQQHKKTSSDFKQTCMTDYYSMKKKNKDTEEKYNSSASQKSQSFSRKNVNKV